MEGYALYAYLKKNKVPTDWKERVRLELEEVNTRRIALTNTLEKGNADNRICKVQWAFMQEQIEYMDGYSVVLSKRLAAALPPQ
ncbi:crAss001_48 related protein [Acinetobacter modestus]|uniref:crAss001_48 related protein n=1 Tax=Acinetobacter modestus TaxID=1776740 RepID=UPI003AFB32D4